MNNSSSGHILGHVAQIKENAIMIYVRKQFGTLTNWQTEETGK